MKLGFKPGKGLILHSKRSISWCQKNSQSLKGKRNWFGAIGKLSKTIFGTATEDDTNLLARHINKLKEETANVIHAVQQHEQDLSS